MKNSIFVCTIILLAFSCQHSSTQNATEKEAIISTLNKETQFFCERNLEKWQLQWSQQGFVYKMYGGNRDFEEFLGWEQINQFTIQHIADNPSPFPVPDTNFDYDIYLFENTAWVLYSKNVKGDQVRETRFMVKEEGQWKIARMQTIF